MKNKSQWEWYEYYKTNPDDLPLEELKKSLENNFEVQPATRKILEDLFEILYAEDTEEDIFGILLNMISRQQDIVMGYTIAAYDTSIDGTITCILDTAKELQQAISKSKRTSAKMALIAGIVFECYILSNSMNQNLDSYIIDSIHQASLEYNRDRETASTEGDSE